MEKCLLFETQAQLSLFVQNRDVFYRCDLDKFIVKAKPFVLLEIRVHSGLIGGVAYDDDRLDDSSSNIFIRLVIVGTCGRPGSVQLVLAIVSARNIVKLLQHELDLGGRTSHW